MAVTLPHTFASVVEDAGTCYCWRDRLGVPQVVPAKP
jgi:hypothetical protein